MRLRIVELKDLDGDFLRYIVRCLWCTRGDRGVRWKGATMYVIVLFQRNEVVAVYGIYASLELVEKDVAILVPTTGEYTHKILPLSMTRNTPQLHW